ncbi:MAG: ACP S-malonyltransferase [Pelolinea sp.]|nr:ACP S-malonyltransferase [Pelolinea sp.]
MTSYSLLFPGQGSQSVGMGKDLYAQFAAAKTIFDEADDILEMALSHICFEGPAEILNNTAITQPAVLVTSYALLKVLEEEFGQALRPTAAAGHSLGEYTALVASGSLSFKDGLTLVQKRGSLMKSAGERSAGGMTAVIGADVPAINVLINKISDSTNQVLKIANDNCPGQLVISGSPTALQEFEEHYKESGAKFIKRLPVSVACHTPLMADAQKKFDAILEQTTINPSSIDVIANTTAKPIREPQEIREELMNQLCGLILWTQTTSLLGQIGCMHFLEIGPGKVLCGLTKRTLPQSECVSFSSIAQLESALQFLGDGEA